METDQTVGRWKPTPILFCAGLNVKLLLFFHAHFGMHSKTKWSRTIAQFIECRTCTSGHQFQSHRPHGLVSLSKALFPHCLVLVQHMKMFVLQHAINWNPASEWDKIGRTVVH